MPRRTKDFIDRLRAADLYFGPMVGGLADLTKANRETLQVPQAFIGRKNSETLRNQAQNFVDQELRRKFVVIVAMDNSDDYRGEVPQNELVDYIEDQLISTLVGWMPPWSSYPVEYDGENFYEMNRARLFWVFNFYVRERINSQRTSNQQWLTPWKELSLKIDLQDQDGVVELQELTTVPTNIIMTAGGQRVGGTNQGGDLLDAVPEPEG